MEGYEIGNDENNFITNKNNHVAQTISLFFNFCRCFLPFFMFLGEFGHGALGKYYYPWQ
jgi:hypothetical protein